MYEVLTTKPRETENMEEWHDEGENGIWRIHVVQASTLLMDVCNDVSVRQPNSLDET